LQVRPDRLCSPGDFLRTDDLTAVALKLCDLRAEVLVDRADAGAPLCDSAILDRVEKVSFAPSFRSFSRRRGFPKADGPLSLSEVPNGVGGGLSAFRRRVATADIKKPIGVQLSNVHSRH
jgi:hypothetical protein